VIAAARDLGVTEPLPHVPSLALGSVGVSLLELTGAFASVRADRMHERPWGVAAVGTENGSRMLAMLPPIRSAQNLDPYQKPLVELLQGVIEYGTGRAAALDGFAAGKTGTSQDYRDAWFIGFNDALVVGVWVGNDDDTPMRRVVGGTLPASIWRRFMTEATYLMNRRGMPVAAASETEAMQLDDAPTQPNDRSTLDTQAVGWSSEPGACDYQACSSTYHSFRASDCTYQPYSGGSRQMCKKGDQRSNPPEQVAGAGADLGAPASCNIDLCARTYSSFRASDCTYQPFGGGARQLCEK
jgi:penicillin-binding protein 1A